MVDLFWAYENARVRDAGTFPPEPLDLAYGTPAAPPAQDLQRAAAVGRPVKPADCGPIRVISRYGFLVRCPGRTILRRATHPVGERIFTDTNASYGHAEVGGAPWPIGDSGFVASWISGSEYVKIQTGVMVFFPPDMYLYQGPLPNVQLLDCASADVMAGLEYPSKDRVWTHDGDSLAWSSINVIVRLPPLGRTLSIDAGTPLAWLFPVPSRTAVHMARMPLLGQHHGQEPTDGIKPS
jgi:hypothetical protein